MANYNLTNQTISSSFQQLLQKDSDTGNLVDGTGSVVDELIVTASYATTASYAENVVDPTWDNITNKPSGLVSGSSQVSYPELSNIPSGIVSSSSQVVLEDTTYTDNGLDSFLQTDGAGNLSFQYVKSMYEEIKNREAFEIQRGQALYVDSNTGDRVDVYLADNSNPNRFPATLIASENISPNGNGLGLISGLIDNIDVGDLEAGDIVYLGTSGGWTNVRPTGSADIQVLGVVSRPGNNGAGYFINQLHTTLPNIEEGKAWVGDSNGVPQAVSTASWDAHSDLTQLNLFTQSQEIYNAGINSYTQSTDVTIGNIETYVTSSSQRIDLIEDFTSSQETLNSTFATTGSNTFNGNQIINGISTQNFTAPALSGENAIVNMSGASIGGRPYNRTFFGVSDYSNFGLNLEDYFAIEYYDSFGYNYGSEFDINGKEIRLVTVASGSGQQSFVKTTDNYDGTSQVSIAGGTTNLTLSDTITITGSAAQQGYLTQTFDAPLQNNENAFVNVNSAAVQGTPYNRVFFGFADYSGFGTQFEDYFAIEYYDGFGYNFGSEFDINGRATTLKTVASGSGMVSGITTIDNNDGTSTAQIAGGSSNISLSNGITVTGDTAVNGALSITDNNFTITSGSNSVEFNSKFSDDQAGVVFTAANSKFNATGNFNIQLPGIAAIDASAGINLNNNTSINANAVVTGTMDVSGATNLGSGLIVTGSTNIYGVATQHNTAPGTNGENAFVNVSGAVVQGRNYNRTFFGMADYPSYGKQFEDYFSIEYYDSFSYNFGSELAINGSGATIQTVPSGSGFNSRATITTVDNYDGTADISLNARNGKVNVSSALSLTAQDPLPTGTVGDLAVSGSNLYFYNGSWTQVV